MTDVRRQATRADLALLAICLGFFLVLFDATAVNVAIGPISEAFGASPTAMQWVLNAYTVAFASVMLTAGSLGDRWGARRVYVGGCLVFALASAVCALAPTTATLIAARAVQGVGAAAVVPCSLALIAHRFPQGRARSRALGIWGGVSGIGLAAGPLVGGGLTAAFGWRSVFVAVVPLAAFSGIVLAARVQETPRRPSARPDLAGQLLAIVALVALTAALTQTTALGWSHPPVVGLLVITVLAGTAFVLVEHRVAEPMLPPGLFAVPRFSGATCVGMLFNFGLYGVLFCLALTLERALGHSSAVAGLAVFPLTVVIAVGALLSGRLTDRFGPRTPMLLGLGGGFAGACLLAVLGERVGAGGIALFGTVLGLVGFAMPAMTGVALAAVDARRAGLAAATLNAARQAGGALGVALLGSLALGGVPETAGVTPWLPAPMALAAIGYLIAMLVTIATVGPPEIDPGQGSS
jgi:DHA2 family methylenomycin A resistance protein-like MFS transporter